MAEVETWLGEYREPLIEAEERAVFTHVLWHLVYSSRCEYAVDPDEIVHRRARPTLRGQADDFVHRIAPLST